MHDPQPFQPSPLRPGQSWPVLPPGVSFAKGLPAVYWPAMPGEPDAALADPLDPTTRLDLVPRFDSLASPTPTPAPAGLGRYLALGLRQTARSLARAWQTFSPAAPAPAPLPPGLGVGAAIPEPAPLGARSE